MLFYDFEFNLLHIEPRVISWRFIKYYNEIGTLEAHLPLSSDVTRLVMENDFLVCSVGGEFAIITGKQVQNELIIYGRTCNWLLSKRVVLPFENNTKLTGDFVKGLLRNAYLGCDSVMFGRMQSGEKHTFSYNSPRYLSKAIMDALNADGLGHEFVYDKSQKKWVFNLLKGEDRNFMISEANKNAASSQITVNMDSYANVCYYKNQTSYQYVGEDVTGLYRFETYLTSGDEGSAKSEILNQRKENTTEVVAIGPVYGKDYLLGDTVRVQITKNNYKVTKRLRVKGVELSSKSGEYAEKPILEEV